MEEKIKGSKRKTVFITATIFIAVILIMINVSVQIFTENETAFKRTFHKPENKIDPVDIVSDSLWENTEFTDEIYNSN